MSAREEFEKWYAEVWPDEKPSELEYMCYQMGLEAAANAASMFSANHSPIHPDIAWNNMNDSAKMVMHTTCQQVAAKIRRLKDSE